MRPALRSTHPRAGRATWGPAMTTTSVHLDTAIAGADRMAPPDIPTTPHKAYVAGREAARRGDDLVVVVTAALRTWPMDEGLGELAELITCASLGYWTEGGGR